MLIFPLARKGYTMKRFILGVLLATVLATASFTHAATDVVTNPLNSTATNAIPTKQKTVKQRSYKPKQIQTRKLKPAKRLRQVQSAYYTNSAGQLIHRPAKTAGTGYNYRCRDGSYSYSAKRRGACSHHGGIAR